MPRTTPEAVVKICPLEREDDDINPFIEAANSLVTAVCLTSDYVDSTLELIERWLSAHFYCILRPQAKFKSAGKVQKSTDSKVDLGLDQTRYGQMAKSLDYAGNLAALDNKLKETKGVFDLTLLWLGTEDE